MSEEALSLMALHVSMSQLRKRMVNLATITLRETNAMPQYIDLTSTEVHAQVRLAFVIWRCMVSVIHSFLLSSFNGTVHEKHEARRMHWLRKVTGKKSTSSGPHWVVGGRVESYVVSGGFGRDCERFRMSEQCELCKILL